MWLRIATGPDSGRIVKLTGPTFTLGRVRGSDLIIRDSRASRQHAEIRRDESGIVTLRDLGSANGTIVGNERISELVLKGGEEINIGAVKIEVCSTQPTPATRKPPQRKQASLTHSAIQRVVHKSLTKTRRKTFVAAGIAIAALIAIALLLAFHHTKKHASASGQVVAQSNLMSPCSRSMVT